MRPKCSRAATAATAPLKSAQVVYHGVSCSATTINDVLTRLLFGLAIPHVTLTEQSTVLDAIDGLIRLKIDAGLLTEGQQS
jgi:hypothetical protein